MILGWGVTSPPFFVSLAGPSILGGELFPAGLNQTPPPAVSSSPRQSPALFFTASSCFHHRTTRRKDGDPSAAVIAFFSGSLCVVDMKNPLVDCRVICSIR
ncbi:unnamed protein product [Linum trigynum]|uniref:Uncharacterized protein n=1 Tax=Linum trigynum TaxID=586398 RepID=A0AAV2CHL2_9ROSI